MFTLVTLETDKSMEESQGKHKKRTLSTLYGVMFVPKFYFLQSHPWSLPLGIIHASERCQVITLILKICIIYAVILHIFHVKILSSDSEALCYQLFGKGLNNKSKLLIF